MKWQAPIISDLLRSQHYYGGWTWDCHDPGQKLEAVLIGQIDVQEDHVGVFLRDEPEPLLRCVCGDDGVVL